MISYLDRPKILISPFSRRRRDGTPNAKHFPYWKEFVELLKPNNSIIQIGGLGDEPLVKNVRFGMPMREIGELVRKSDIFISVDSFLPHLVKAENIPVQGIVLFSKSDPAIFGYDQNINVLRASANIRENNFFWWEEDPVCMECWPSVEELYAVLVRKSLVR